MGAFKSRKRTEGSPVLPAPAPVAFDTERDLARDRRQVHQFKGEPFITKYRCTLGRCKEITTNWRRSDTFRAHLQDIHGILPDQADSQLYLDTLLCYDEGLGFDFPPRSERDIPPHLHGPLQTPSPFPPLGEPDRLAKDSRGYDSSPSYQERRAKEARERQLQNSIRFVNIAPKPSSEEKDDLFLQAFHNLVCSLCGQEFDELHKLKYAIRTLSFVSLALG